MYMNSTLGATPASLATMRSDVANFISSGAQGVRWAGGILSCVPGGALYESLDGPNGSTVFNANSDFDALAASNPGIAREWYSTYGFVPNGPTYYFGNDVLRNVNDMLSWRVKPGTPGTGWSGMDGQYNYVARKDIVDAWLAATGSSLPAGSYVDQAPNGNLIVRTPSGQKPPQPAFAPSTNPTAPVQSPIQSVNNASMPIVDTQVGSPAFITTTAPAPTQNQTASPAQTPATPPAHSATSTASKAALIAALLALFFHH